jgi:hypothetical protein
LRTIGGQDLTDYVAGVRKRDPREKDCEQCSLMAVLLYVLLKYQYHTNFPEVNKKLWLVSLLVPSYVSMLDVKEMPMPMMRH